VACSFANAEGERMSLNNTKKEGAFVAEKFGADAGVSSKWSARDDKSLISTQPEKKSLIHGSIGFVWSSSVGPSPYRQPGR
jgi:hypothetical protein